MREAYRKGLTSREALGRSLPHSFRVHASSRPAELARAAGVEMVRAEIAGQTSEGHGSSVRVAARAGTSPNLEHEEARKRAREWERGRAGR